MPTYTPNTPPTSPSYTYIQNTVMTQFDDPVVLFDDPIVLFDGGNAGWINDSNPTTPSYTNAPSPS